MSKSSSSAAKKKQQAAIETSETIEEQVQAFLKSGNEIEQVPTGRSGITGAPSRHITISSKR